MNNIEEFQKRRILLFNKHLDNTREFQYKYFELINSSLEKSETAMMAAFLSFSALGINFSIKNQPSFEIWLFVTVILINLVWPTISNIYRRKKSQHFLNIIRQLEPPIHEFTNSSNLKSGTEIEASYSRVLKKLKEEIEEGNKMSEWIASSYSILRVISLVLLITGWVILYFF